MSKIKSAFFCSNCGYESAKWIGKCPSCAEWNTFSEEIIDKGISKEQNWDSYHEQKRNSKIIALDEVKTSEEKRIISKDPELNRVLGGGIVMGSIVLVAGEPGIGKSTLLEQSFLDGGVICKQSMSELILSRY